MSKYYKAEDIQELITACEWRMTLAKERHGEGFVDYSKQVLDVDELTKRLADLPTIEISEDCISRSALRKEMEMYGAEITLIDTAPSVVPQKHESGSNDSKISESNAVRPTDDCISREDLLKHAYERDGVMSVSVDSIKLAPSVAPTTEQSSMVGEWLNHYYPHFEVTGIACSVCGKDVPYWSRHNKIPNYCPNCGAKMKG